MAYPIEVQIGSLQRQIRILWFSIGIMALALVIVAVLGTVFGTAHLVKLNGTVATLTLVSPKTGNRLVLSGNGFQLLNNEGDSLAWLSDSSGNASITLTNWSEDKPIILPDWAIEDGSKTLPPTKHNSSIKESISNHSKEKYALKKGPSLVLTTSSVEIQGGFNNNAKLSAGNGDSSLIINNGVFHELVESTGFRQWNTCGAGEQLDSNGIPIMPPGPTCYESHFSLSDLLGLQLETCQKYDGQPLSKMDKDKGCESIAIITQPFDGQGANILFSEDGISRLLVGSAVLTSTRVGGQEITPLSQITAFDKKGIVVWKIPQQ